MNLLLELVQVRRDVNWIIDPVHVDFPLEGRIAWGTISIVYLLVMVAREYRVEKTLVIGVLDIDAGILIFNPFRQRDVALATNRVVFCRFHSQRY